MEQPNQEQKDTIQNTSDWRIGELYQAAINLVKKNKVLWLFALALGSTGSYSFHQSSNLNKNDIQTFQKLFQNSHQASHKVLGASTNIVWDTIKYLFSAVYPAWYALIGIEFLFLIVIGTIISLVYHGWAEAGLLEGIENAIHEKPVSIKDTSEKAFSSIKSLIWVRYIPTIVITGVFFLAIIVALAQGVLFGPPLMIILVTIELIAFICIIIMVSFSLIWAVREIVVDKKPGKAAFFAGLKIAKKKFWSMVGLGFLNVIIAGIATAILAIPLIILFAGGIVAFVFAVIFKNMIILGILIVISIILLIAAATFFGLGTGIVTAFTTSVWSLAYNKIRGKYDK